MTLFLLKSGLLLAVLVAAPALAAEKIKIASDVPFAAEANVKVVASFRARRNTGGGPTCAALAKCAKSLGKDIAGWIAEPSMDAKLGDAG